MFLLPIHLSHWKQKIRGNALHYGIQYFTFWYISWIAKYNLLYNISSIDLIFSGGIFKCTFFIHIKTIKCIMSILKYKVLSVHSHRAPAYLNVKSTVCLYCLFISCFSSLIWEDRHPVKNDRKLKAHRKCGIAIELSAIISYWAQKLICT